MDKKGVLVIEDNITDGLVIKRTLSKYIHEEISVVRDGTEALSFLSRALKTNIDMDITLPKLITLDLNMPKMNGFEFIERFKKNEQTKEIPIIVLTSSQLPDEVKKAYYLGANSYVIKPTDHEKFEQTIEIIYEYWFDFSKLPPE
ncbi:MAG TPA: response regulator [Candidatus Methanofastidiosa archaeon]|nr:response regulator [Candidatus Methanofastidiosa archaeon]HPR42395.1 response regulator [Candidatus Methanofastidiosa archaeon]